MDVLDDKNVHNVLGISAVQYKSKRGKAIFPNIARIHVLAPCLANHGRYLH